MKKILIISLLVLGCSLAASAAHTERKTITHRFEYESAASKMHVNSKYGNVTVTEGNQNFIDVRVEIIASARNSEAARKILDRIDILFSGKGTSCSAKTEIKPSSGNDSFEINYLVTIPKGARFDVVNKYGNTSTGDLTGTFTANVKYGNINASALGGSSNTIDLQYGNASVVSAPELKLSMSYSNFNCMNIAALRISSKYSTVNADYVGDLKISSSSYDSYSFKKVVSVESASGTSGLKIGTLVKSIRLPGVKYGQVDIDNVEPGFERIEISSSYAGVRIGFTDPSFGYVLKAKYGDVNLGNIPHQNKRELRGYTDATLEGHAGSDNKVRVNISTNYSSINLSRN